MGVSCMMALRTYLSSFITDPLLVDIVLGLFVLLAAAAILRLFGFGIFKD